MIKEFCDNKPKNEKCIDCRADLLDCTTNDELLRGEAHYVRGLHHDFCVRDEKQITRQQAISFWHLIPAAEREQKYGDLSEFLFCLECRGYIKTDMTIIDEVKDLPLSELGIREKDLIFPETLKESNPQYAAHLEHIGAKFYKPDMTIEGYV